MNEATEATTNEGKAPPSKDERDFHIKEWEFLRTDIRVQIEHSKNLEFATVVALAVFYAWIFTSTKTVPRFFLLPPSLLVLLGALRSYGTLRHIQRIAKYIRTLEEYLSANHLNLIGWDRTRDRHSAKSGELKASASLFWVAAFAVTIVAWWLL